ncbi:MAG: hypothetical protein ACSHW0_12500 [Thalassotalea sp.]
MRNLAVGIFILSSGLVSVSSVAIQTNDLETLSYSETSIEKSAIAVPHSSIEYRDLGYVPAAIINHAFPEFSNSADETILLSHSNKISVSFFKESAELNFQSRSKFLFTYNRIQLTPDLYQHWDWQREKINLHYFHLSEKLSLTPSENTWLYAGVGFTYFENLNSQYQDDTAISMNIGINTSFQLTKNVSLSFDSKVYGTLMNGNLNRYCANEECPIETDNDVWLQQHTSLQLTVEF